MRSRKRNKEKTRIPDSRKSNNFVESILENESFENYYKLQQLLIETVKKEIIYQPYTLSSNIFMKTSF